MDHQQPYQNEQIFPGNAVAGQGVARAFMANVFLWMFVALGISAGVAFAFSHNTTLLSYLVDFENGGLTGLGKASMFAPLVFVFIMSLGYARLPAPVLTVLFILYAAITGLSLSFILLVYTEGSVYTCFLSAAAMFGVMAVMGYRTTQDLTSFGRILMMGLMGMLVAVLINFFMKSDTLSYVISLVGIAVFTGLTAYDVQKLRRIGEGMEFEGVVAVSMRKTSILGALTLYLDFLNLFLSLLRVFGRRN